MNKDPLQEFMSEYGIDSLQEWLTSSPYVGDHYGYTEIITEFISHGYFESEKVMMTDLDTMKVRDIYNMTAKGLKQAKLFLSLMML